jgi:glycosyltransferase
MKTKISIITCCKNSLPYLKDNINSVKKQSFKNFEHLFILSKSKDNSEGFLRKIKYKNKNIFNYENSNIYNCINFGIKKSKGNIIFLLHSDDLLSSNNIFEEVNCIFQDHKKIDYIYTDIAITKRKKTSLIKRIWKNKNTIKGYFFPVFLPAHTSFFIKKKVFKKIGLYSEKYKISADFEFLIRLFKNKNIKGFYLKINSIFMRTGGLSSNSKYFLIKLSEDINILKKIYKFDFLLIYFLKILRHISQIFLRKL